MVTLLILDGFGEGRKDENDAIFMAGTPKIDALKNKYPNTTIEASGKAVGLIPNQIGNSEVGHLNIGAGRVIFQDLARISYAIEDGSFFNIKEIKDTIDHAKKNNSDLHIMGLLSDGGVHSHIDHLKAILNYAKKENFYRIYLHAITDGRDVLRDSGKAFIADIENFMEENNIGKLATIVGRIYAMDREKRYDRVKIAYDLYTEGKAEYCVNSPYSVIDEQYKRGIYDEFFTTIKIENTPNIKSNDSIIFFNFRTDRAREITDAFTQDTFSGFERNKLENLCFTCMTEYDSTFKNVQTIFKPVGIDNTLSVVLSKNNKKQFRITETTKYAHVTFFFNGGIEEPYEGEERYLIDSIDVKDYSEYPHMRALEITEKTIETIKSGKYDFVMINISNPDMIGHTGNFAAAVEAIKCVDECVDRIVKASIEMNSEIIVTADHGNAELMADEEGNIITAHTNNVVPFILISEKYKDFKLKDNGKLANISPTILKLLNIEKPSDMTEDALF